MRWKKFRLIPHRLFVGWAVMFLCWASLAQAADFLSDESYEDQAESLRVADPIEPFNRAVFTLNDKVYIWVLEPVATGYSLSLIHI